jgi:hypothetical protein
VFQDFKVNKAHQVELVHKVQMDHKALPAIREHKALKDLKAP